jgi:methylaspartate ammonia-lyase
MVQHIADVITVKGFGAHFHEDKAVLHHTHLPISKRYVTPTGTKGFTMVRQPAFSVSVGLVLADGRVTWGDCISSSFSALAGRQPIFDPDALIGAIRQTVAPLLVGQPLDRFRRLADDVSSLTECIERPVPRTQSSPRDSTAPRGLTRRDLLRLNLSRPDHAQETEETEFEAVDVPLHPAIAYGVSQALLAAVAADRGITCAEILVQEYGLVSDYASVPLVAQCGTDWYDGADKMIVRRIAALPHALIDDIPHQLAEDGSPFIQYVSWLRNRILELAPRDYSPTIDVDFHGAIGALYDNNPGKMLGFLTRLSQVADPFAVRVESPIILSTLEDQIEALKKLREYVSWKKLPVQIAVDEWANTLPDVLKFLDADAVDMVHIKMPDMGGIQHTVEAILACKANSTAALLGGSCAETDLSTRISTHIALAAQPDLMLAKPGMGIDEAISITFNEMARANAEIRTRVPHDA